MAFFCRCRYTEQARLTSQQFRDNLVPTKQAALHWVKHVAKNRGAPHFHSDAVQFPFYVYYNLDVWAFIFVGLYIAIKMLMKCLSSMLHWIGLKGT